MMMQHHGCTCTHFPCLGTKSNGFKALYLEATPAYGVAAACLGWSWWCMAPKKGQTKSKRLCLLRAWLDRLAITRGRCCSPRPTGCGTFGDLVCRYMQSPTWHEESF